MNHLKAAIAKDRGKGLQLGTFQTQTTDNQSTNPQPHTCLKWCVLTEVFSHPPGFYHHRTLSGSWKDSNLDLGQKTASFCLICCQKFVKNINEVSGKIAANISHVSACDFETIYLDVYSRSESRKEHFTIQKAENVHFQRHCFTSVRTCTQREGPIPLPWKNMPSWSGSYRTEGPSQETCAKENVGTRSRAQVKRAGWEKRLRSYSPHRHQTEGSSEKCLSTAHVRRKKRTLRFYGNRRKNEKKMSEKTKLEKCPTCVIRKNVRPTSPEKKQKN